MSISLTCITTGIQSSFGMPTYGHETLPRPNFATTGEWSARQLDVRTDVRGHVAAVKATRNGRGTHAWRPPTV